MDYSSRAQNEAKQCPWCERWALKDNACSYIFACGLADNGVFVKGAGCGRSWCWSCGKKYCGVYIDVDTGAKTSDARDHHDEHCCTKEPSFSLISYCHGGHSSHCNPRWRGVDNP